MAREERLALRAFVITGMVIGFVASMAGNVAVAAAWPGWIPGMPVDAGWARVPGARVSWFIEHPVVNPAGGASMDCPTHAELFVDGDGHLLALVYIDLDASTNGSLTGDVLALPVPAAHREAIDNVLSPYTSRSFTGSTAWDLVVFTFIHAWNARLATGHVDVEVLAVGPHPAVLLDHGGAGGLGHLLLANLATRVAIAVNIDSSSPWSTPATFNAMVPGFLFEFLQPLREVLHAARFSQAGIVASSIPVTPAGGDVVLAGAGSLLDREAFMDAATALIGAIPRPVFPIVLSPGQVVMIIAFAGLIGILVYTAFSSYTKERARVDGDPGSPGDQSKGFLAS